METMCSALIMWLTPFSSNSAIFRGVNAMKSRCGTTNRRPSDKQIAKGRNPLASRSRISSMITCALYAGKCRQSKRDLRHFVCRRARATLIKPSTPWAMPPWSTYSVCTGITIRLRRLQRRDFRCDRPGTEKNLNVVTSTSPRNRPICQFTSVPEPNTLLRMTSLVFQISAMVIATGSRPRKKTISQPPPSTKNKRATITRGKCGIRPRTK